MPEAGGGVLGRSRLHSACSDVDFEGRLGPREVLRPSGLDRAQFDYIELGRLSLASSSGEKRLLRL
jgi:hypothetical protein